MTIKESHIDQQDYLVYRFDVPWRRISSIIPSPTEGSWFFLICLSEMSKHRNLPTGVLFHASDAMGNSLWLAFKMPPGSFSISKINSCLRGLHSFLWKASGKKSHRNPPQIQTGRFRNWIPSIRCLPSCLQGTSLFLKAKGVGKTYRLNGSPACCSRVDQCVVQVKENSLDPLQPHDSGKNCRAPAAANASDVSRAPLSPSSHISKRKHPRAVRLHTKRKGV